MKNTNQRAFCLAMALLCVLIVVGCGSNTTGGSTEIAENVKEEVSDNDEKQEIVTDDPTKEETTEATADEETEETENSEDVEEEKELNYSLYSDENISVILKTITDDGVWLLVENKLDTELYYTSSIFSFDGLSLSDYAGLIYNTMYVAPNSTGELLTELEYVPIKNPSFVYGFAYYGTDDGSIEQEIEFTYGEDFTGPYASFYDLGTVVYEDSAVRVEYLDMDEYGATFLVFNNNDSRIYYVNETISFNGNSYGDGSGLIYNSTEIAPNSVAIVTTELTRDVDVDITELSGSGKYSVCYDDAEEIEFSYSKIQIQ